MAQPENRVQAVFDQSDLLHEPVRDVMGRPFPSLDVTAEIDRAYKLLTLANPAIVVTERDRPVGVLTRSDIITFFSTTGTAAKL